MMRKEDPFHTLVGRALIDEEFRDKLLDPKTRKQALQDVGVESPTDQQLQAVENAKGALEDLSNIFGEGFGAA